MVTHGRGPLRAGVVVEAVSLRANADSRAEFRPFMECFRQAVGAPPELLKEPAAEID